MGLPEKIHTRKSRAAKKLLRTSRRREYNRALGPLGDLHDMHKRKQRTWRSGWRIGVENPDAASIHHYESLFALANGYTGAACARKPWC